MNYMTANVKFPHGGPSCQLLISDFFSQFSLFIKIQSFFELVLVATLFMIYIRPLTYTESL